MSSSVTQKDQLDIAGCSYSIFVSPQKTLPHQQLSQGFQDLMRTFKPDGL